MTETITQPPQNDNLNQGSLQLGIHSMSLCLLRCIDISIEIIFLFRGRRQRYNHTKHRLKYIHSNNDITNMKEPEAWEPRRSWDCFCSASPSFKTFCWSSPRSSRTLETGLEPVFAAEAKYNAAMNILRSRCAASPLPRRSPGREEASTQVRSILFGFAPLSL